MPLYRSCALVCDVCSSVGIGALIPNNEGGDDLVASSSWNVIGERVLCDVCSSWEIESPEEISTFTSPDTVSEEFNTNATTETTEKAK